MEIERKFLVSNDEWRTYGTPVHYAQGYLVSDGERTVRVRVAGEYGYLTIKGKSQGISRTEFEYMIPVNEAVELLKLSTTPVVEKYRTKIYFRGNIWEVDEFEGRNKGLIMAEIELVSENQTFAIPSWIGEEVTGDFRYFNAHLAVE